MARIRSMSLLWEVFSIVFFRYELCYSPIILFPVVLLLGLAMTANAINQLKWSGNRDGMYGHIVKWSFIALAFGLSIQLLLGINILMDPLYELDFLYTAFLVNASLFAIVIFFRGLEYNLRAELGICLGTFMVFLGFGVAVTDIFKLPQQSGPYWLVFGCTQFLVGSQVWQYHKGKDADNTAQRTAIALGTALFLSVASISFLAYREHGCLSTSAAIGWMGVGCVIIAARLLNFKDAKAFLDMCGSLLQAGIGGILLAIGVLLMSMGRLAESVVEVFLCIPILYHASRRLLGKRNWKTMLIAALIIVLEIVSLMALDTQP